MLCDFLYTSLIPYYTKVNYCRYLTVKPRMCFLHITRESLACGRCPQASCLLLRSPQRSWLLPYGVEMQIFEKFRMRCCMENAPKGSHLTRGGVVTMNGVSGVPPSSSSP